MLHQWPALMLLLLGELALLLAAFAVTWVYRGVARLTRARRGRRRRGSHPHPRAPRTD